MSSLTVAVGQPFCQPGDVAGNIQRMRPLVEQAADGGARLILFSEAGLTGWAATPLIWDNAITLGDRHCEAVLALAKEYDIVIAAGFIEQKQKLRHNAHAVFYPNGAIVVQRKVRLTWFEQQIPNMTSGTVERMPFIVDGVKCAISICADTAAPNLENKLAAAGIQVHLVPSAGCLAGRILGFAESELEDPELFDEYLVKAESVVFPREQIRGSHHHRIAQLIANQLADDGVEYFHCGHCFIIDSTGELVGLIPGSFVFEHLRPRVILGEIHPRKPRVVGGR
jgi:predicted amidohydrolase